jgi:hypothetical protein
MVHLSIAIPEAQVVDAPALLRLVRRAPVCDTEADDDGPTYVALFDDFPTSVETVVRLIEESWDLHDVRILIDGQAVDSRTKFYVALLCYQGSLGAPDVGAYCLQQAKRIGQAGGCPDQSCASSCQFICAKCVGEPRGRGAPLKSLQHFHMAHQPDVDWCPNLRIAKVEA